MLDKALYPAQVWIQGPVHPLGQRRSDQAQEPVGDAVGCLTLTRSRTPRPLTARLIAGSVDEAPRAFFRPAGSACRNGLLTGYRGTPAMDPDALEQLLLRVAQVAEDFPEVSELDLNPVVAVHDGVAALDVKLKLRPAEDEPDPYIRSLAVRRAHRPNH